MGPERLSYQTRFSAHLVCASSGHHLEFLIVLFYSKEVLAGHVHCSQRHRGLGINKKTGEGINSANCTMN